MRKICTLILIVTATILFFSSIVLAYQDYLWVYRDPNYTEPATAFDDGDTVYVTITDYITQTTPASITVTNNVIGNSIDVSVSDSGDPTVYKGHFVIHSGLNNDASDELRIFDGQTATITADLDRDGKAATMQITALYIPPAPTNLKTTPIAGGKIKLAWTASNPEDTVVQYNVYRGTTSGGEDYTNPVATVTATGSTSYEWTDSNLSIGQTYYYTVRAKDRTGDESESSNEVSATAKQKLLVCEVKSKIVRQGQPLDIILSVSKDSDVYIRIYNLREEIVREDTISISSGAETEWKWDGENMYGQQVNNGIYMLWIKAVAADGEKQTNRKIIGVLF